MSKYSILLHATSRVRLFASARDGGIALVFGFALVPLILSLGAATDLVHLAQARGKAQNAIDAAALAGASAASASVRGGAAPATAGAIGDNAARAAFNANISGLPGVSLGTFTPGGNVTLSSAGYTSTAQLTFKTNFMRLAGFDQIPFTARSTARTSSGQQYIDVYVLVDASQSMGLGASATDQADMRNDPAIGCSLACHNGHGTHPANISSVTTARNKGYKLRFDVIRDALNTIVDQAQTDMTAGGAIIRFGVYSFANNFKTEIDIGSNYGSAATPNSIRHAISVMDIADASAGTSIRHALEQLKLKIGAAGNGSSAAQPKVFVLLMTDGVGNSVDNQATASPSVQYDWTTSTTIFPSFSGTTCWSQQPPGDGTYVVAPAATPLAPPCVPDPYVAPSHIGNGGMELNGVDPSWCAPIKSAGATLMTLNTTYVATEGDEDWRSAYLRRVLIPSISGNLQSCASSPADFFVANEASEVTHAIDRMFKRVIAMAPVRLTQ